MLRKLKWSAGSQRQGDHGKRIVQWVALAALLAWPATALAVPLPVWSNTLESDATSTVDGGEIVNSPSTYVPGAVGNAFAGNGDVYASWDNADVAAIFDTAWDNSLGSTIDLYFQGDHWDNHSGDSGLWTVVDRLGGDPDGYYILSVRDGSLRFPYRDSYSGNAVAYHLTGVALANDTTYQLTVRQFDNDFEVYLDGGAYSNAAPIFTSNDPVGTISFPEFNDGSHSGGRAMTVGTRAIFGGTLQSGEWVDQINVYNGYHTPAELAIPEPASVSLLAVAFLPLLCRRRLA
jgi:hypothetical protein